MFSTGFPEKTTSLRGFKSWTLDSFRLLSQGVPECLCVCVCVLLLCFDHLLVFYNSHNQI